MAGNPIAGDSLPANLAGMSKNQLYDIMSQMKSLIEQNQQQARQILIQNPLLTKALFQAQIMLGMVQPPQLVPTIQPSQSQNTLQSVQATPQPNVHSAPSLPGQGSMQDPAISSQIQIPPRKQHQNQPAVPVSSSGGPVVNHQSQPMPVHSMQMPQQHKGHHPQMPTSSLPQPAVPLPNISPAPLHSSSQPLHQPQIPAASSQLQQPLQASGLPYMPLQPPLQPPQHRPPSVPNFQHQYHPQIGPNMGYQHSSAPHNLQQSMFHPGTKLPANVGPSFPQGQPPLPSQLPNQYQADRGSSWMAGPAENSAAAQQLPGLSGPPPVVPGQMSAGNQPRPSALTPEMEKALLQQVMSLTQQQINLLPPEQRNQVLQLQQMLRQ